MFQYVCTVMAAMLHYSVISMFCWMLIEGFHLYIMLVKVFRRKANFRKYLPFGWGTFNVHDISIKHTECNCHSTDYVSILINWFASMSSEQYFSQIPDENKLINSNLYRLKDGECFNYHEQKERWRMEWETFHLLL